MVGLELLPLQALGYSSEGSVVSLSAESEVEQPTHARHYMLRDESSQLASSTFVTAMNDTKRVLGRRLHS